VADEGLLLLFLMALIILGGIGWTALVDIYRHRRRFRRYSLDTKLVIVTSLFLWMAGALLMSLAEYSNADTLGNLNRIEQIVNALFHSVSARTTGLQTIDFGQAKDFTKLTYSILMFIGGGAASMAGGIKVNVLAVVIAAVISALRARQQAEAFGREIASRQVQRALTVGVLSMSLIIMTMPVLTITEPELDFLDLLFDTVSAFGTVGLSTGIAPDLSLWGKIVLMIIMLIGRLGPLTLVLALAPQRQPIYHFIKEPVFIG
jgi:trk system potassium uptake protein TrkH